MSATPLWRDETGAVLVEVTILLPIVIGILCGSIDFLYAFYQWNAAAKAVDDFVGKLVGDEASCVIGGDIGILFAEYLRRSGVLNVVEPTLHGDFSGRDGKIAEGQHGGVGRRRIPDAESDFRRLAGNL